MKRHKTLFWLVLVIAVIPLANFRNALGQELSTLGQQKPVTVGGVISARTLFYHANGIPHRRSPFSYVVTGAPVVSLYGWSVPVSFVFSEQERGIRQPFNQFGMSPTYKWLTIHAGYRNLSFSPYTMAGHTVLGGGVEGNPGLFRFGFLYGRFNRATAVDTTSGSLEPFSYTRWGYAAKVGVGKGGNSFDLSVVKATDDSTSAQADATYRRQVRPAENVVFGASARLSFLKQFYFEGEGAVSLYTRHIGSRIRIDSLLPGILTGTLGKFIRINGSTEFYSAYQTALGYRSKDFSLKVQYRRVDPSFRSMGTYFFVNDVENVTITPSLFLLNRKLRFSGSLGLQRDNLQNQKQATARRVIGAANLSLDLTERLGIDLNFSNFTNQQRRRTLLLADTFLIAQTTRNFSIAPRYLVAGTRLSHTFILSYSRMTLDDLNPRAGFDNNIRTNNLFVNYQLTLVEQNLSFLFNANMIRMQLATGENGNEGLTLGVTKGFYNNKLTLGLTNSLLRGNQSGSRSTILNNGLRMTYQKSKKHVFNLLANFIGNYPSQAITELNELRFSEWRGEAGYTFNF